MGKTCEQAGQTTPIRPKRVCRRRNLQQIALAYDTTTEYHSYIRKRPGEVIIAEAQVRMENHDTEGLRGSGRQAGSASTIGL